MRTSPPPVPSFPPFARPPPTAEDLSGLDVHGFLDRLDRSLDAISTDSSLRALLPDPDVAADDPRFSSADALFRRTLRGTLVATSFRDLAPEARVHPAVQRRMWSAMDEIDAAVHGIGDTLGSLTSVERARITRALRERPELGDQVLAAIASEAERAGVSSERRAHLLETGKHACFRLRQSTSGLIDEYTEKLRKVRDLTLPEAERHLAAQLGEAQFTREKDWHLAVQAEWQKLLEGQALQLSAGGGPDSADGGISADDAYAPPAGGQAPPPLPPIGFNPDRGKTVLRVGAWLFGFGVMAGFTGALLVSARSDDVQIAGLFAFTAAAVLSLAGLICLLIGGILRLYARGEAEALLAETNR